jgi:hypothetical protein
MSLSVSRVLIVVVIGIVVVGAIAFGWGYLVFVRGSVTTLALGGKWELDSRSTPMSHGGGDARLFRRDGWHRAAVDELILTYRDYGDDCIAYSTSRAADRSYYAACGDREPVLIGQRAYGTKDGEPHLTEWRIDADGIAEIASTESRKVEQKIPVAELKRRALAQPPRTEDWRKLSQP